MHFRWVSLLPFCDLRLYAIIHNKINQDYLFFYVLGEDPDGDFCVQFGMVTNETEVHELVRLVISTGEEIEESSEFFHQMSELVKKGNSLISNQSFNLGFN